MLGNLLPMSTAFISVLTGLLPIITGGIGYFLKKEVDRKYILGLEAAKQSLQGELEAEKTRQQIKFKAELIAELLAEWISNPTELTKLNQLSYLAFLWLPDDIALDLSALLSKTKSARSVPRCIVPECGGLISSSEFRQALRDKYSTAAPVQQRQFGTLSNVVRKAYKRSPPAMASTPKP